MTIAMHPQSRRQGGASLVETMVGLTLGLMVTLVVTQVWGAFEGQKQRTISSSSAQVNGLLALTELEQDIRSAGAGLANGAASNCLRTYTYYESGGASVSPVQAYVGDLAMIPLKVVDSATGSDTLIVKRASDLLGGIPATVTRTMPSSSSELNLSSTTGFADQDTVLVMDPASGNCTVMLATQVQPGPLKLQHNPGDTTTYNPTNTFQASNGWPAYGAGASVEKIGQLISHTYAVGASNQLVLTDTSSPLVTTTSVIGADVVRLKAHYGVANAGSEDVSNWVRASAASGWGTLDGAKVKRIKAVRLAIVARSSKREGTDVTAPCKDSGGSVVNPNGPCIWADSEPVVDLSSDPDWKRYRYRIYQTIIPLRNLIWAGA